MANNQAAITYGHGKGIGATVGIALLGMGTVGAEVFRLINENANDFEQRIGGPVAVRGIAVSDTSKERPGVPTELLTTDAHALINRDDVDVVVSKNGELRVLHFLG